MLPGNEKRDALMPMQLRSHLLPIVTATTLLLSVSLRLSAQQPTKATENKSDKQDQTKEPSLGTFRGRFRLGEVPGKVGPASIKLVFQDLVNCRTYDIIQSGPVLEFSTVGFYVVVGRVVGGRLEATSSTKADEAATGQLSALARKCSPGTKPDYTRPTAPATSTATTKPASIRVPGEVQAENLIRQIKPTYPSLAKQARIQGTIRFNAVIATDGMVKELQIVSGHPMLVQSALEAVKQWEYRPTLSNGQPVEVLTTIDVNFTLDQ